MSDSSQAWIGVAPSATQRLAVLGVGVNGILIAGLQPLLLGLLSEEGRLSAEQLGQTATVELLTMGAAGAIAGAKLRANHLRPIGISTCLLLAALEVATTRVSGNDVLLVRALAGIPSGIMIWIASAMIARSLTPERWAGIYFTVQTLAQFLCAAALTAWVIPHGGANGGFWVLAGLSAASAGISLAMPPRFAPLSQGEQASPTGLPPTRGFVALIVAFLYLAFIVGVWVYAEPLSRQSGHDVSVAGTAVSLSLACQVVGGALATILAGKLKWFVAVVTCSILNAACLLAFAALPTASVFLAASGIFGFLWMFVLPFLVPMTIAADPTRRAALMLGGAQLLGASLGPLLVSFVVTEQESRGAIAFGGLGLGAAFAISIALRLRERQGALVQVGESP